MLHALLANQGDAIGLRERDVVMPVVPMFHVNAWGLPYAAALAGSLGIAPTGNIDPERRYPSMFEPIHGSAFDIAGKGIANPVASFWTAAQMLEHLGEPAAATRLMAAVERVTASGLRTPDLHGDATTQQVTDAVCEAIHSANA